MGDERLMKQTVGLILIRDNKVLLMKRCNTGYEDGKYALVAGHVENKESLPKAMIREAKEEVGIDIKEVDLEYFCSIEASDNYINYYFVVKTFEKEPVIMENQKCEELVWFDLNRLPIMIENDRKALTMYIDNILN